MDDVLAKWSSYIGEEDINYLREFFSRANNYLPNDKILIIVGDERTGKTTLISQLIEELGETNVASISDFKLSAPLPKLFIINEQCKGKNKRLNQSVNNLIVFKQSMVYVGRFWKGVFNNDIMDNSYTIQMTHKF